MTGGGLAPGAAGDLFAVHPQAYLAVDRPDVVVVPFADPLAELLRREITVGELSVDAAVTGDRQLALQALLLDPVITDLDVAQRILDDYLTTYQKYLPQFWQ